MKCSNRLGLLLAAPVVLAPVVALLVGGPAGVELSQQSQGTAQDLGVMALPLKEAVPFNWGFQARTQAAGTPNAIGIGGFLPLAVGAHAVAFLDALANVNLADIGNSSSIINSQVAGTTIATSTRLGYRWLNGDRSWMFGVNAGYDSRPMATGQPDTGIAVTNPQMVFFQQLAAGLEAMSNTWSVNAYALVPIVDTEQHLNSVYDGGALKTYGLDLGYSITPEFRASLGCY